MNTGVVVFQKVQKVSNMWLIISNKPVSQTEEFRRESISATKRPGVKKLKQNKRERERERER